MTSRILNHPTRTDAMALARLLVNAVEQSVTPTGNAAFDAQKVRQCTGFAVDAALHDAGFSTTKRSGDGGSAA